MKPLDSQLILNIEMSAAKVLEAPGDPAAECLC